MLSEPLLATQVQAAVLAPATQAAIAALGSAADAGAER